MFTSRKAMNSPLNSRITLEHIYCEPSVTPNQFKTIFCSTCTGFQILKFPLDFYRPAPRRKDRAVDINSMRKLIYEKSNLL